MRFFGRTSLTSHLLPLLVAGCGTGASPCIPTADGEDAPPGPSVEPRTVAYASELEIDFSTLAQFPSGLYCVDRTIGGGTEAASGNSVSVHYTGYLPDGSAFDSSLDRGAPFSLVLGAQSVIWGWELGIPGMREGGRRTLVIPPHLGYGPLGAGGVIPPNAVLVFDVELLEVN